MQLSEREYSGHLFPVTAAQKWLLTYFPAPYEWYDRLSFSIRGPIDSSRVEKALALLVSHHEGLRTSLKEESGVWRQEICSYSLSLVPLPKYFASESEYVELKECREFDIGQLPLFKLLIVKGENLSKFVFLFHHAIVDYIAMVVIYREFIRFYQGDDSLLPLSQNSMYARSLEKIPLDPLYWHQQCFDLETSPRPSSEKKGAWLTSCLGKDVADSILRYGKKRYEVDSLHYLFAAPIYRVFAKRSGKQSVTISHKLHGRNILGTSFFSTVGNYAINVPVTCRVEPGDNCVAAVARAFKALPLGGMSYDLTAPSGIYPDFVLTPVRLNYMGILSFPLPPNIDIKFLEFATRVGHPEQLLTASMEFFIFFSEGNLYVKVCYDTNAFEIGVAESIFDEVCSLIVHEI